MGNLCGKESKGNFEGQGRVLGSAPAPATKASVPSNVSASAPKAGGPARTVGGNNGGGGAGAAAAAAAEVKNLGFEKWSSTHADGRGQARNNKSSSGELQKKLDAQKRQTQNQTLQQVANENRLARAADQATETRNYN